MQFAKSLFLYCTLILLVCIAVSAQQAATATVVPRLVNFSDKATDALGKPITGIAGITFSIYNEQYEGASLWMETQNVTADAKGNYTVQLGATSAEGLPLDLFTSGEARWLGVRVNGGEEQARVLLLSVPYALKAADAQTLGGLPASAFVLAAPPAGTNGGESTAAGAAPAAQESPATSSDVTTSGGTVNTIPMFTTATNVQNSLLTQTGTTAINVGGKLNLPALGAATASAGFNSRPQDLVASVFNGSIGEAVPQTFQWQAEPLNNDKSTATGTLNLLYASGTNAPAETGLKIASNGQITFAPGQTLPSVSVTGDLTASQLISTVATGMAPLKVTSTTEVANLNASLLGGQPAGAFAQLAASNTFTRVNNFSATTTNAINANSSSAGSAALNAVESATSGGSYGVYAATHDSSGAGVRGINLGTSGTAVGVYGTSSYGYGVEGAATGFGSGSSIGVAGFGFNAPPGTNEPGTVGINAQGGNGDPSNTTSGGDGVTGYGGLAGQGATDGSGGVFVGGAAGGDGVLASAGSGYAGFFFGNVAVTGNLSKSGGSFKIDHPLDPVNKYLYHSFVESPDMMNIYNGNVTTDGSGLANVTLPDWFETLNRDFRYQLTVIGQFAQAIVGRKIEDNQFQIRTSLPNVEVSWQVTGIRQDPWANAHRIPVEEEKEARLKGFYIHPELYRAPPEKQIEWARHPQTMKRIQEHGQQIKEKQAQPLPSATLRHGSAK
jgi:trimeric autotransporter adhesin